MVVLFMQEPGVQRAAAASSAEASTGLTLAAALRTPAFWVFAGATSLFGLVSSGLGLFNEAVLAERGFNQETYHTFLAATAVIALVGQFGCGWLTMRWPMQRLLGLAMFIYALALVALPFISTLTAALGVRGAHRVVGRDDHGDLLRHLAAVRIAPPRQNPGSGADADRARVGHRAAALRAVCRDDRVVRADSLDPRTERFSYRSRWTARGSAGQNAA